MRTEESPEQKCNSTESVVTPRLLFLLPDPLVNDDFEFFKSSRCGVVLRCKHGVPWEQGGWACVTCGSVWVEAGRNTRALMFVDRSAPTHNVFFNMVTCHMSRVHSRQQSIGHFRTRLWKRTLCVCKNHESFSNLLAEGRVETSTLEHCIDRTQPLRNELHYEMSSSLFDSKNGPRAEKCF